jgi:Ca-activated chloride channel homolog
MVGLKNQRLGATMVLVMLLLPAMISIAAMAINIAYMELIRTETQISIDAATRAAGYEYAKSKDAALALQAAQNIASKNTIGRTSLPLAAGDLVLGTASRPTTTSRYSYAAGGTKMNAVWIRSTTLSNQAQTLIQPLFPVPTPYIFRPLKEAISVQCEMDIALVLDRSGSMAYSSSEVCSPSVPPASAPPGWVFGDPVPPNARWLDLVAGVQAFLGVLNVSAVNERVSLTTYNHASTLDSPISESYAAIGPILNSYSVAFQQGATGIGTGMLVGLNSLFDPKLNRPQATKVMVVMTDGMHNSGITPEDVAPSCASSKVIVYTVSFSTEANQTSMQTVADATGGRHIHAVNAAQLIAAFQDIARSLPTILIQ